MKPKVAPAETAPEALPSQAAADGELPRGKSAPEPQKKPPEASAAARASHTAARASKPSAQTAAKAAPSKPAVSWAHEPSAAPRALSAAAAAPPQAEPEPAAPPPAASPAAPVPVVAAPKVSVSVPHTDHVRVEVPAGLQHWLDEDDRMRPWLSKAVSVADSCYASERAGNPAAGGVISVLVTMHENARPSGMVSAVSGSVGSVVMCATTRMLGVKMPLFTGTEGESYTVRVRFEP